ncbi:hypothetical protein MIND_01265800 [Mycena indigotica]|uniref:NAD-dependent epimerase/dehydratase domain-containing protein n=1 Tax=Mycena indigotica TaxID=2126181 RepID=A0A8H6S216_9AGAR|nr:uncharacterized protein MIND_01265800 [Mycena indigotica]KAF7291223.1 hypothetical protein MIND_01265800 [Mycena indigotica]
MPGLATGKVLVSGASGFIAAWVVRSLLEAGFSVRGTVRSENKTVYLKKEFASYGDAFELVVVPDIAAEGAFDEAVRGVDAVAHTASPFRLDAVDPDELILPAIRGTVGMLKSVLKHGSGVKRVVITGSCASVIHADPEPKTFSEVDWNEQSPKEVEEMGRETPGMTKYFASKTLAERAAWNFMKEYKSQMNWDLVVINPPFVFGPTIHDVTTPSMLNTSTSHFFTMLTDPSTSASSPLATFRSGAAWIDVRDLGTAHVRAFQNEEAGGERIIVTEGSYVWQNFLDEAPEVSPKGLRYQKGISGCDIEPPVVHHVQYDTRKAAKLLGIPVKSGYRSIGETVRDTVADWEARGWV